MATANINVKKSQKNSMFQNTPLYRNVPAVIEGKQVTQLEYGLLNDPVVPDNTDVWYTVPTGVIDRLDRISLKFYGTVDLWWVIACVNFIADPLTGFQPGQKIRVPTKNRLSLQGIL